MAFGDKLREAFDKLQKATVLDKSAIKEAVKDIQRELIASDISIDLVLDLSKRIEEKAFEKLPEGLSRKEHIIKATYDLLIELLGGQHKPPEKPRKILLVGLFGSGKCVDGNSLVPLSDGRILKIKEIYEMFKNRKEKDRDGFRINLIGSELVIPSLSLSNLKIEHKPVEAIWRLRSPSELYEIAVDNGNAHSIVVTPEHPFFVLNNAQIANVRADCLKEDSFIALPYNFSINSSNNTNLIEDIFSFDFSIFDDFDFKNKIKSFCYNKYGTLTNAHAKLLINAPFCSFVHDLKNSEWLPIEYIKKTGLILPEKDSLKIKPVNSNKTLTLPTKITSALAEFLGYIVGDGHIGKNYVETATADKEIIERLSYLGKELFSLKPIIKKDKRSEVLFKVIFSSTALVVFFNKVFKIPVGKKSDTVKIPEKILCQNNEILNAFIRAYLDCDSHVVANTREIEVVSASESLAKQISTALLRFNIFTTFSIKIINNKQYYRLHLTGRSAERYASLFGSVILRKKNSLNAFSQIGAFQGDGKKDMVFVGKKLRLLRELFGQTIGELQETCSSYGSYEKKGFISRNSLNKMLYSLKSPKNKNWLKIIESIQEDYNTPFDIRSHTGFSQPFLNAMLYRLEKIGAINKMQTIECSETCYMLGSKAVDLFSIDNDEKNALFEQMHCLANSDLVWAKVKSIKKIKPKDSWVYDLTVKDNHNFIANNTIVHNTTVTSKLAKWYFKRGNSVGVICADTFRAAAFEQLQQNAQKANVPFFGLKDEKNAARVASEGIQHFKDKNLIIIDSAGRSALDNALVKEIKEIHSVVKPDFVWLVLSADIGQIAKKQAIAFHEAVNVNGVIITKMDGSAKGGGALAACAETKAPVYFIGVGEKIDDLQEFDAQRFLGRVMGYGDLQTLLEKSKEVFEEEEFSPEDLLQEDFTLKTFYQQLQATKKIGTFGKIAEMIGLKKALPEDQLELGEEKMKTFQYIMDSMTEQERKQPDLLNANRIKRIAKGAGRSEGEVRELLKNFKRMKRMFEKFKKFGDEKSLEKLQKMDQKQLAKFFGGKGMQKKKMRFKLK